MHRVGQRALSPSVPLHHIFDSPAALAQVRATARHRYVHCLDRLRGARENRFFLTLLELTGELLRETAGRYVSVPLNFVIWFECNDRHASPLGPRPALLDLAEEIARLWTLKDAGGLPLKLYPVSPSVLDAVRRRSAFYGDRERSFSIHHLNALLICLGMALYDPRLDAQDRMRRILRLIAPYTADMLLPDALFHSAPSGFRALYLSGDRPRMTSVMLMGAGLSASVAPMTSRLLEMSYECWKRGIRGRAGYDRHDIAARVLAAVWSSASPSVAGCLDNAAAFSNDYLW